MSAEAVTEAPTEESGIVGQLAEFPELAARTPSGTIGTINHLYDVSVNVTAELGRMTLSIADILKLGIGSVVSLDRTVSEPVDLLVQGVPFARGEVVVIEDRFAIRIREIIDPKQAIKK